MAILVNNQFALTSIKLSLQYLAFFWSQVIIKVEIQIYKHPISSNLKLFISQIKYLYKNCPYTKEAHELFDQTLYILYFIHSKFNNLNLFSRIITHVVGARSES